MKIEIAELLQLHADNNIATTADAGLSAEMKSFYKTKLIRTATPKLLHRQWADHQPLPKGNGKTVEWRRWSSFSKATTPLTEGVTPSSHKLTVAPIYAQVQQYGDYTTLSDMVQMTTVDPILAEHTDKHGENMGLTLDTICRNAMVSGLNVAYAPKLTYTGDVVTNETAVSSRGALDSTARITPKLIAKMEALFKKNNVPTIDGYYICIVHPYVAYDLMRNPEFMEIHKYTDAVQEIFEGEVGKLYKTRFVESSEAKVWKGEALDAGSEYLTNSTTAVNASTGTSTTSVTLSAAITTGSRILSASATNPILLNVAGETFKCVGASGSALTIQQPHAAIAASAKIYPGDAGSANEPVFACLYFGKDAYGDVEIDDDDGIIVKPLGSGGTEDPLNQRGTTGWKRNYVATIKIPEYLYRIEVCSEMGGSIDEEN